MPASFFDVKENNAGTLSARLAVDCKSINNLVSSVVKVNIMNLSSLITGLIIAFIGSW
jgi:ATP-binding cassette subfamily B (MDR/TAP) protein 1